MSAQAFSVTKKSRGRPKGQSRPETIPVRIPISTLAAVEKWIARQPKPPSRPEAIKRLLEHALRSPPNKGPANKRKAQKASDLADRAAERLVDKSIPPEEQQHRKRALIKGPKEFRDIREDLPKTKS
jgi:hypothetical protein